VIPIHDVNPSSKPPIVTKSLIAVNVAIFIIELIDRDIIDAYSLIPISIIHEPYRLLTHMFLHGGIMHLFGNMLYLWIFGDNVEDFFGHGRFLLLYLMWGLAASAVHLLVTAIEFGLTGDPRLLSIQAVGASGAISGVLGAYAVLYPNARVLVFSFIIILGFFELPAWMFLGFWFIYQLIYGSLDLAVAAITGIPVLSSGVAYWAHIGGFIAGALTAMYAKARRWAGMRLGYGYLIPVD